MLFSPKNVTPSAYAGVGGDLVDATQGMTITWQLNGSSPMEGYNITIYKNNALSTQLYTTGLVTLATPFYGTDGAGNTQTYSVTIPAATLSANGIANSATDTYKFTVANYFRNNSSSIIAVGTPAENLFVCNAAPTVSISASIPAPKSTVTGTWTQAQGVQMERVRWVISTGGYAESGGSIAYDSGTIHTQILSLTYDGFLNNTTYYFTLYYQLQNGYAGTAMAATRASWSDIQSKAAITATPVHDCADMLVKLPVPTFFDLAGESSDVSVDTQVRLVLPASTSYAQWGTTIDAYYPRGLSANLYWCLDGAGGAVTLTNYSFETADSLLGFGDGSTLRISLRADGRVFWTAYDNTNEASGEIDFGLTTSGKTASLFMNGYQWYLVTKDANGKVLSQSAASPLRYGMFWRDQTGGTQPTQYIRLEGEQTVNALGLIAGFELSDALLTSLTGGSIESPGFTADWLMLITNFNYRSSAGTVQTSPGTDITPPFDFTVYRTKVFDNKRVPVFKGQITSGATQYYPYELMFYDYSVCSGGRYIYSVEYEIVESETVYGIAATASNAGTCNWDWIIVTAELDEDTGLYIAKEEYRFGLNVESGTISNNNAPNLLQNFTPYPLRQGVSANYRSGTLTAYIGKKDENGGYTDTAEQAEEIYALCTSGDVKFLRNRKGEMWMIDTAGAVTMQTGDKYKEQPYNATIPWVEIGDAENAAVIWPYSAG